MTRQGMIVASTASTAPRFLLRWHKVVLLAATLSLAYAATASWSKQLPPPDDPSSGVEAMLREGRMLWQQGALEPAMNVLERALARLDPGPNPIAEARCRNLIGNVADSQGEFDRGAQEHSRALLLAERAGDRRLAAEILADSGTGLWRRAEYPQALAVLDRALALQGELGLTQERARTLVLIGRVHFKQGDYHLALDRYSNALAMQEAAGDRAGAAVTLEDIGDAYLDACAYSRAMEHFERSLALREALGDRAGQTWILTVIGTAHLLQGAFADAEQSFLRALAVAEAADDPAGRAQALYHLGLVHMRTGEYQRAVTSLATAARLHDVLGDRRAMAWDLENLGLAHHRAGDQAGALQQYSQVLAVREAIQDLRALASTLDALGVVQEEMGELTGALATYRRALALGEELHLPYVCLTLGRIGRVLATRGNATEARAHGRQAVDRARLLGNRGLLWQALYHLAEIERRLGQREAALRALHESMAVIDDMRWEVVGGGDSGASFLDDKQVVFSDAIALLFESGREGAALEVAERARARAFLDLLATRRTEGTTAVAPALRGGAQPTRRSPDAPRAGVTAVDVTAVGATGSRPATGRRAMTAHVESSPASLSVVRATAHRRHATLVEYFVGGENIYAWVANPDGRVSGKAVGCSRHDLDALVEATRRESERPRSSSESPPAGDPWRRLHQLLVEPLVGLLPADPEALVILAPHGPLWAVPFAGLRDASGRLLVEQHTLAYVPALGVLAPEVSRARPGKRRALIVGNPMLPSLPDLGSLSPLPAAGREAAEVAAALGGDRVTRLIGADATEKKVRSLAPRCALLHFATHGLIRDDSPLDSMLVLGAGGRGADEDGRFTAREILDLDLDAELVVLSGCDTGRGRITGDGVLGLGRAFLAAGASTVLVSLSRVEDQATRELMVRFYQELMRNGGNRAAALRHAQLAAIRKPLANWVSFVLIGETR